MKTILGIDPGTKTGFSICHANENSFTLSNWGQINLPPPSSGHGNRMASAKNWLDTIDADYVVCEKIAGKKADSWSRIYWGLITLIEMRFINRVAYIHPMTMKKELTGNGKANKSEIIKKVKDYTKVNPETDHTADSFGLAYVWWMKNRWNM